MKATEIKTSKSVVPKCYAYSTPTIPEYNGWVKIGYTEQDNVEDRIKEQLGTIAIPHTTEWYDIAVFNDGVTYFHDTDFHAYLEKNNVERKKPLPGDKKPPEIFKISGEASHNMYNEFRQNKGIMKALENVPYVLRDEQEEFVKGTKEYFDSHENSEVLWNAKPRFGKTLTAYELCKRMKADKGENAFNVLIVTNRPAIANSWYEDYVKFLGENSGFVFVSETDSLKNKSYVYSRKQFVDETEDKSPIEFLSLQDLKGSVHFGGDIDKLNEIKEIEWDLLIIDEAHEGVDTYKTDVAFTQIKRKYTLHLSGTPFKALANEKFKEGAVFNWTYADEQKKKNSWNAADGNNPYENLPKLNLFTYKMSDIIYEKAKAGIEINGENHEFTFNLNDFFETNSNGGFLHEKEVDKFLDTLTHSKKYPFSTPELRKECKHTLWILNRVSSAKALAKKLNEHPVFENYKVVLAAGDGKLSEDDENKKSFNKVREAISKYDKTITISVGQLTTGVTIPEWTAVLMLSNMKSPALYMQAAFRAQNPWRYTENKTCYVKENAYVFDFDPARTLTIYEKFANDLCSSTSGGKGANDERKENVNELLNFFPVIGEDENGEMVLLDAEKVLSIPRKIHAVEVVRKGFMCNFLFQNISNVFGAPQEILDIIDKMQPLKEGKAVDVQKSDTDNVSVDENGEVEIEEKVVIGLQEKIFGDKFYDTVNKSVNDKITEISEETNKNPQTELLHKLQETFVEKIAEPVVKKTTDNYKEELKVNDQKEVRKKAEETVKKIATEKAGTFTIKKNENEINRRKELDNLEKTGKTAQQVNQEYDIKAKEIDNNFIEDVKNSTDEIITKVASSAVETAEKKKTEKLKDEVESNIRDHLRGFARTIPSFLMAYGNENTTLENFDTIIPDNVFKEVTSISIEDFRFLRDGGKYIDKDTNEEKTFNGNLFDSVVFNDSVKEFMLLKKKLANYFDEKNEEDIFDYIPPQKTNQIFTPKKTVKQMVDMLEEENPGCFDNPDKTFIDLYMKSGLFIAEIVKRLYNSEKIKEAFPDKKQRLKHIFEKQVFGLAPTEIIYRIALSFILGFTDNPDKINHNLKMFDALPYAKDGSLESKLDEIFS